MLEREGIPVLPFCPIMMALGCEDCRKITRKFGKEFRDLAIFLFGLGAPKEVIYAFLNDLNLENS